MANDNLTSEEREELIERTIKIYLEEAGSKATAASIEQVKKKVNELRKSIGSLTGEQFNLNSTIREQAKEYAAAQKQSSANAKKIVGNIGSIAKSFINLGGVAGSALGEITSGLKSISGLYGFSKMVKDTVNYEESLLSLSAQTNRLGIGINELERDMISLGNTFSLTRTEVMSLFSDFSKNYRFPFMDDFEPLLQRIQMMVGSNKDKIQEYQNAVGSLSQEYSGLAQEIATIGKKGSESDKESLRSRVRLLSLSQKIGESDYQNLIALINGNKQLSEQDKKKQETSRKVKEVMQDFKEVVERIALMIGPKIVKQMERLADWINKVTDNGENMEQLIYRIAGAMAGLKLAGLGASLGKNLLINKVITGSAMGGVGKENLGKVFKTLSPTKLMPNLTKPFVALGNSIKGLLPGLSKFGLALGKLSAYAGAAAAGWAAGTAIYNKAVEPWLEKRGEKAYEKVMEDDDSFMTKATKFVLGIKKDPNAEKAAKIRERMAPKRAKKEAEIAEQEKKAAAEAKKREEQEKRISMLKERQMAYAKQLNQYAEALGQRKEAEKSLLSSEIKRMQLSGKIDMNQVMKQKDTAVSTINEEIVMQQKYLDILQKIQLEQNTGGSKTIQHLKEKYKWTDKEIEALGINKTVNADNVDVQTKIIKIKEKIVRKSQEIQDVLDATTSIYKEHLNYAGLLAEESSLMVQIADNYAIGVGASAQARMAEYNALQDQLKILNEQKQLQMALLRDEANEENRLEISKQIQQTKNEELQIMLKQAGITKSLRDGWIEAIGSMNTGAGTFTKIILDQTKGTAQSLKLAGQAAVISSRSGSLEGGYKTSEKFSSMQGIAGQGIISGAQGKRNFAYQTTMGRLTGSEAEGMQWGARSAARARLFRDLGAQNRYSISGGGGSALGFTGSKHYEGIVGESGPNVGGFQKKYRDRQMRAYPAPFSGSTISPTMSGGNMINVNVSLRGNASQVSSEIAQKIGDKVAWIVNNASSRSLDDVDIR